MLPAKNYPIGSIKIDQAFVDGIERPGVEHGIVGTLVKLGHVLRVRTTLEGVETKAQFDAASDLGIDRVQGFYIAPAWRLRSSRNGCNA
jgi:EAL domain-containing protein (putative c-di-GMP-specific phosphodiesterase class I)